MKKNKSFIWYWWLLVGTLFFTINCKNADENRWPNKIETVLNNFGGNRLKFEQVLTHYHNSGDSLKFKAACFLLGHINTHYSKGMVWVDTTGRAVDFNELDYNSFDESLAAFDTLKAVTAGINAKAIVYRDADTLSASFLIDNIENAFKAWQYPWNRELPFVDFCEYILPYRVSTEPVQEWRKAYFEKNNRLLSQLKNSGLDYEACELINNSVSSSFFSTYNIGKRQEPIPLLGPLNLLHRMQGDCADLVNYTAYCMRSMGIPATVDFVPYWGTSSGRHFWNVTLDENGKPNYFMGGKENPGEYAIYKELPKVYRITYQEQPGCIGAKINNDSIPDDMLKMANLKDVTSKYVKTTGLELDLGVKHAGQAVFLCVHNNLKWKPVCGEIANSAGRVHFKDIGCGIIYLPMVLKNMKFYPVDYPYCINHSGKIERKIPDREVKQQLVMNEEEGYLIYRPGKIYKLYYWDNKWRMLKREIYKNGNKLIFNNIPKNSVLVMIPEYTWGKERPFTIGDNSRIWW